MFGYVRPFKPDLRIREFESYKAVYCGLCGQLGQSFGPAARLTLSYDFAFLAMLHYAVTPEAKPIFETRRCYVNPLRRLPVCLPGETLAFSADMALLMLYYKLLDNMSDSGFFGRMAWGLLRPFATGAHKKAAGCRPQGEAVIAATMAEQRALEDAGCDSVDAACEPTAKAMAGILGLLSDDERQRRVLERTGYLLGRYIYLCDALDDLSDDLKKGCYNPFARRYGLRPDSAEEELLSVYQRGRDAVYLTAGEAAKAYQLLDTTLFGPILDNVFYQGLRAGADQILLRRMPKPDAPPTPGAACVGCPYKADEPGADTKTDGPHDP